MCAEIRTVEVHACTGKVVVAVGGGVGGGDAKYQIKREGQTAV